METELHTQLAIVGAGPAGLAAAEVATRAGRSVVLIDDNPAAGGQVWRRDARHGAHPRAAALIASLRSVRPGCGPSGPAAAGSTGKERSRPEPPIRHLAGTRVVAAPAPGRLLLEDADGACLLHYDRLILASGARERLLPFPGWTLPGVTGAGGLQALAKSGLDLAGSRVVLAGSGPLLLAAANTLRHAGAEVLLIAEQAPLRALAGFAAALPAWPARLAQAAGLAWRLRGVPYRSDAYVLSARGGERLESVRLQLGERQCEIACDWLGVGFGLLPNLELARALGCEVADGRVRVDGWQRTSLPTIHAAGEATGVGGLDKALLEGRIAALAATGQFVAADALARKRPRQLRFAALLARRFALRPELARLAAADTVVCRCEDVRHSQLAGFADWREAKLQTRCGMGPCQGRICGAACETLYGWPAGSDRPPLQPARLVTLTSAHLPITQPEATHT
ncbi:NAD(P)/FAD-dependent oxidoreductase [Chitinimonas koreensis]|uniref:NAD(P)/FAD-dependent oxidoreductase n=1 Tax=Chitinimonas koreensis TaxID=356302 RepID=UPI0004285406|nr:FAD/NAD(P)-binding oxidoreductase [Chitinimonas koreensis]QNM98413.1 NAD(P)/FAD-dependent oxidoreductase [Chitinimonas koreensis]